MVVDVVDTFSILLRIFSLSQTIPPFEKDIRRLEGRISRNEQKFHSVQVQSPLRHQRNSLSVIPITSSV